MNDDRISEILRVFETTLRTQNRIIDEHGEAKTIVQRETIDTSGLTIPKAYQWAERTAEALALRVTGVADLNATITRILGSERVVFIGPAGSGKTSLACAALREARRAGRNGIFEHAYRLATARAHHSLGEGEAPTVVRAMTIPLLVLDDLGTERRTELSAVSDVIFERHAEGLGTWVTTGFTAAQLAERYGDGIARRLFESATVIQLQRKPRAS